MNLAANPAVTVQLDGERFPAVAATASGPDRDRLLSLLTAAFPGYADHERKADRQLPVVVLRRESERG